MSQKTAKETAKQAPRNRKYYYQHTVFITLLLLIGGLLSWTSNRYALQYDWTLSKRNTLSDASIKILQQMNQPLQFTVYATESEEVRKPINDLIERYKQHKADIQYSFIDPNLQPALVRESGVQTNGEVVLHYGQKSEHLRRPTEANYSNAMQRLLRSHDRWILFITGHGERDPKRNANHDLSVWADQLSKRGLRVNSYQLAQSAIIPDNTATLVIASPLVNYLPGEVEIIKKYLENGGNLLWLMEPGDLHGLQPIADMLKLQPMAGTLVDKTSKTFGIKDHSFLVIAEYPMHDITRDMAVYTLFPQARGIQYQPQPGWQYTELLKSSANSWVETGALDGNEVYQAERDSLGPVSFGLILTRKLQQAKKTREQRIIVIGDGDFLSNTYLGNVGNMELGYNIVNWLNQDDQFLAIPVHSAVDKQLLLDNTQLAALGIFFFFIVPLGFFLLSVAIWYRRRAA